MQEKFGDVRKGMKRKGRECVGGNARRVRAPSKMRKETIKLRFIHVHETEH